MSQTPDRTRDRVVLVAMELFGRHGFRTTTVAQIERAAGLSPGAGGLYRHFASKEALLRDGLRRQVEDGAELRALLAAEPPPGPLDLEELVGLAGAGLARLRSEQDLNRLLLRDLAAFPDLLAMVRDSELRAVHAGLATWLRARSADVDADALAAVLMSAVSHYWVLSDVFGGTHPLGVDEQRYLRTAAQMAFSLMGSGS